MQADTFDPAFYHSRYPDLEALPEEDLRNHYENHGRSEGRLPNIDRFLVSLSRSGEAIPPDFMPRDYRRRNADVDAQCQTDWDAYIHYSEHGAAEGRPFSQLDLDFYKSLYLADRQVTAGGIESHMATIGRRASHHVSMEALLQSFGMENSHWLESFSAREFSILNFDWLGAILNREQAILRFLQDGIDRIAPISSRKRFDPIFYRETNPELDDLSDAQLYLNWLQRTPQEISPGSPADWFAEKAITFRTFPAGFAWRSYTALHLPQLPIDRTDARWVALSHLINNLNAQPDTIPAVGANAADFLTGLAEHCAISGRHNLSIRIYERARMIRDGGFLAMSLADCYADTKAWRSASDMYDLFHDHFRERTIWSIVRSASCRVELFDFGGALGLLLSARPEYGGSQVWRNCVNSTIEGYFEYESMRARACYSDGTRADGDAILVGAVSSTRDWWTKLLHLPIRSHCAGGRRVVMLAVTSLRQCKHYRLDQKRELLKLHDVDIDIFDYQDVDGFLKALPGARAVIFYRLPAFPHVVRAIVSATSQKIPTYYDIDDLIFDSDNYPDSYESFQGAISPAVYESLMFGTPLHRAAMQLCDFGIASTPALAEYVARYVQTKRTFVVRNALDSVILSLVRVLPKDVQDRTSIRIFYGSGTLAHNQDFNDIATYAILPLMLADPRVELVIAGHLDLDPQFEAVGDRVVKLGIISPISAYWSIMASCDINLATLADTVMNDCKSEIKWLEAAALGLPSIVSSTATYRDVVDDGVTGIVASSLEKWASGIKLLVDNVDHRARLAQAAHDHVVNAYSPATISKALMEALAVGSPEQVASRSTKKRVLIVNAFYPPQSIGGATRVVADNVRNWQASGAEDEWEFAVATTDYDSKAEYRELVESWEGVPVFRIVAPSVHDLDWRAYDPGMKDWFHRIIKRFDPDIVHFHCIQRLTGAVIDVCLEEAVPYVVSMHDGWWLSDYQFMFDENCRVRTPGDELRLGTKPGISLSESLQRKLTLNPLLRGASALITPSANFARIYADAGYPGATVVANGLPNMTIEPRTVSPSGRVRIGHIGDTSPHKGFDLIEAALRQNNFENLELVGVSHGQSEGHEIHDIWGASPVLLRGKVPQERVGELYASLDVLVAPSACVESYGLVTREANAAGLWVIASDRGAIGEDVRPGIDGFIVDVSTPAGLADAFRTINDNPAKFLGSAPVNDISSARQQSAYLLLMYEKLLYSRNDCKHTQQSRKKVRKPIAVKTYNKTREGAVATCVEIG